MGLIVAIEGADGAGKATAAANLARLLEDAGRSSTVVSFPRYSETVGGYALGEFLSGRMPRAVSAEAAAVLYALDRLESRERVREAAERHDVVVMDRYIASNIAYQAAKVPPAEAEAMMAWIVRLETETFALPPPDLSVHLDTPLEFSRELMLRKNPRAYTERSYDEYEADEPLQHRVRSNYAVLASRSVLGPWLTVSTVCGEELRPAAEIAEEIADWVLERLSARAGASASPS